MNNVKYVASWRPESEKYYTADAQKVADEIFALGKNPDTKKILDMARNENTEIHKLIDWDDNSAAEKYRLEQVRHIQRDLQVVEIGLNKKEPAKKLEVPVRMFYHLHGETGYRPTPLIIQDEDLHKKLLRTAKLELDSYLKKYAILTEMHPLIEAINSKLIELKIFDEVS